MKLDYRGTSSAVTFTDEQTIRAKVLDGGSDMEARANDFLRWLGKISGAEIIGIVPCDTDAVLVLYQVPVNKAA